MSRIDFEPHPEGAQYAMRFQVWNGNIEAARSTCAEHAKANCPTEMQFALREGPGWIEWYAPAPETGGTLQ